MRYLSYYREYPIYEPAEGGYYYAGNQLVKSERLSNNAGANLKKLGRNVKRKTRKTDLRRMPTG